VSAPVDLSGLEIAYTMSRTAQQPRYAVRLDDVRAMLAAVPAPATAAALVDTPELQRLIEYWRDEPYGTSSFENAWSELIAHLDAHTARAVAAAVEKERASEMDTIRDRDQYHEWADKLAEAIAKYFGSDIGEHSNVNCPWAEALDVIEEADPAAPQQHAQAVHQWRKAGAADWYDGHPDNEDGGGPYEVRVLYTQQHAQAALSDAQRKNAELVIERLEYIRAHCAPNIAALLADEALPCARAILAASHQPAAAPAVPEGWKLVPLKLTPAMRWDMSAKCSTHMGKLDEMYECAIAAAPAQPEVKP